MRKGSVQLIFVFILGIFLQACSIVDHSQAAPRATDYVAEAGSQVELNTKGVWEIDSDPNLPNVLLLGDSISIGYTLDVRQQLQGKANVFRPTKNDGNKAENCQGTRYSMAHIERWLGQRQWQVIHFNWGLHDLKHVKPKTGKNSNDFNDPRQSEPEVYRANLAQLVARLQATGAKLIFATTTPYPAGVKPARLPADAKLYNDIARQIMHQNNIQVNDLYAQALPQLETIQLPKNVHFNLRGRKFQATQVSNLIEQNL